jgi:glycosyltransferase involved in cell wall biosynthesis
MERQTEKWGRITRALFLSAEKKAVRCSDSIVCDHPEIAAYYEGAYSVKPAMIAYGASPGTDWDEDIPGEYGMSPGEYYLLVARLEPENKIRMIIEGFLGSDAPECLVIVGRHDTGYGKSIYKKFADETRIKFLGGLYDRKILDHLRHFSKAVFHGHSVGGTNPSLLESMAAAANIIAHDNIYNRWVLGDNSEWFYSAGDITSLVSNDLGRVQNSDAFISNNLKRIRSDFVWNDVVKKYEDLFKNLIERK